jgi:quercetin dioxygenase-like cupin family protein
MKNKHILIAAAILFCPSVLIAQVQVSKEPMHKKVLENKYVRLMNVWLQPGDTTMFHIHSTPSVFLHFSNTSMCSQVKGQDWLNDKAIPGKAWYRSFSPEIMIHRVTNCGTVPLHVTDAEILSSFDSISKKAPMDFPLLFETERAFAYSLTKKSFTSGTIYNRGPMIAELVTGDMVYYVDASTGKKTQIKSGGYLYIEPGAAFSLSFEGNEEVNMVVFEIK